MKREKRAGSAVVAVLGIISIIMIVTAMLGSSASRQMRATQISREMLKARLIAESGLNKAYNAVKNNFDAIDTCAESTSFGGGTYTVTAERLPAVNGRARARLIAESRCGIGRARVGADIENVPRIEDPGTLDDNVFELDYDLLVGSSLDLKGNFYADVVSIHANGDIELSGSSSTEAVTISSTGDITWKKSDGTEIKRENADPVAIYSAALTLAINSFLAHAQKNGAVYDSGSDVPVSPPGGVAVCTGSADGWSKQGTGTFIFLEDISLQGSGLNITAQDGYPALILLGAGEVKINADAVVHGAILMPNASLKLNGHAEIYGPILIGQSMTGNGTADLYAGDGQGFNLPPGETTTDHVIVTAWH